MSANSYPAQEFFPEACKECPMLVGYIEDGDLLGDVTKEQVDDYLLQNGHNDEDACNGPFEYEIDGDKGRACAKAMLTNMLQNNDF